MAVIDAQGTVIKIDDATPGTADVVIGKVKSYSGFDGEASEVDITNLASTAKEFRLGLQDFGAFSMDIQVDYADAGQDVCRTAQGTGATKTFNVTFPDASTADFTGLVKNATSLSGGVDGVVDGTITIKISGAVTFS